MRKILIFISICLCFLITSCSAKKNAVIPLTEGWQYAITEPDEKTEFRTLGKTRLPNLEQVVPGKTGIIWLKKEFTIPTELQGKDLSCYLGRITMADSTSINGVYIGGEGRFPPAEFSAWNTARLYHIPSNIISQTGTNTLLIKILVDGEGSIVSNPFISTTEIAKVAADRESFWNSKLNLLFAFAMIVISIYHFILFIKRPKEKESLVFAVLNIVSALYMSVFYLCELPGMPAKNMSFLIFQKIFSSSLPFVLAFLATSFVNLFLERKEKNYILIIRYALLIIPVVLSLCMPDYAHLRELRPWTQPFLIPPVLYVVYIIGSRVIQKQKDALPLLFGFSPLATTILLDLLLHDALNFYSLPYFTSFGWQLVILSLLFVLATKFTTSRTEVEELNTNLEHKVAERTNDLSAANAKLEQANERAAEDMKLAVFVQQSFYPRKVPAVTGWDIAYHFQPMSGVSGDLYDFFTDGNELKGIGLFDVSGHGISSGLVTMLAKTIIDRKFSEGIFLPLSQVMTSINDTLITEKGEIQNYLTGLLVRITDGRVEYVNGGHPPVFYRASANGSVGAVEVKNHPQSNGGIIGMDGIAAQFAGIGFTMKEGDALLMYTDCLSESTNEDGEQFGVARISRAFSESGNGTAQEKIDYILRCLHSFTGTVPLNDDLTVIVLQREPGFNLQKSNNI